MTASSFSSVSLAALADRTFRSVFDDAALNRDLYLWLAAQSACHTPAGGHWIAGHLQATALALQAFFK